MLKKLHLRSSAKNLPSHRSLPFYLVDAQDINEAKNIVKSFYDNSMTDYDIVAIVETPITTFVFDHKVMPL